MGAESDRRLEQRGKAPEEFRFTRKEIVGLVIGTAIAVASLRADDPWILLPFLTLSLGSFLYVCVVHSGPRSLRVVVGVAISIVFLLAGGRVVYKSTHPDISDIDRKIMNRLNRDEAQDELLKEFPYGYTLFELNSVTETVEPKKTRPGKFEHLGFDFSPVRVTGKQPDITVTLPRLTLDGRLLVKADTFTADIGTMESNESFINIVFEGKAIIAAYRLISFEDNRMIWVYGIKDGIMPPHTK